MIQDYFCSMRRRVRQREQECLLDRQGQKLDIGPCLFAELGAAWVFLASHYARALAGDTIYIDGGDHILG